MDNVLHGTFTSEIKEEITQLGEALLAERGRRLAAKGADSTFKTGLRPVERNERVSYPELLDGFKINYPDNANAGVFHDGRDSKAFKERPLAMHIDLAGPLKSSRVFADWIKEALAGAKLQLAGRAELERSLDHVVLAPYANANEDLAIAQLCRPNPVSFELANYRPTYDVETGFHYAPGFTIVIRLPSVALSSASENGTRVESRVVVRGFSLSTMAEATNLAPLIELTKAIRARIVPQIQENASRPVASVQDMKLHTVGSRRARSRNQ